MNSSGLARFASAYRRWIDQRGRGSRILDAGLAGYGSAAAGALLTVRDRSAARQCRHRLARSIHQQQERFRFANEIDVAPENSSLFAEDVSASYREIHPRRLRHHATEAGIRYQIVFMLDLATIPMSSLPERSRCAQVHGDLLSFPTGGGAEAYLGLSAYTIELRVPTSSATESAIRVLSVLMRYTLRLLTLQQFLGLRAAALSVCV